MKYTTLLLIVWCFLPIATHAEEVNTTSTSSSRNDGFQLQEQNGSLNNVQINNNLTGEYSINGVRCSTPSLSISAFGTSSISNSNTTGGAISLNIPLGGNTQQMCAQYMRQQVEQKKLETQMTSFNMCKEVRASGIKLSPVTYPELYRMCFTP